MKTRTIYNSTGMKVQNKRSILEYLRIKPCSRAELARITGLTRSAISVIVDNLLQEEVITEGALVSGKVGRTSYELTYNPYRYCIIGISLGRSFHEVGLTLMDGTVLSTQKIDSCSIHDSDSALETLCHMGQQLKNCCAPHSELLGVGITTPGPIHRETGRILNPPNMPLWQNYPVIHALHKYFSVPIIFERDVNAIALAERYYGVGKNYENYLELNLDSGVGGGIVLSNELYTGSNDFCGQIGHMTIDINGPKCQCGNIGCVELYASLPNIVHYAGSINPQMDSWENICRLALGDDDQAKHILKRESSYLASMIINVLSIVDLQAIIINGKAANNGELLIRYLYPLIIKRLPQNPGPDFSLILSALPEDSSVLSACNLVINHYIKTIVS